MLKRQLITSKKKKDTEADVIVPFQDGTKFRIIAKGSEQNIGQVCGSLGFLAIEGKLAPKKYNNRTMPYFHQNDDRCTSRGLIKESYTTGLSFPSFSLMLTSSRESTIEQVIKTGDSGYMQRKLVKTMEDIMVKYDYTIRASNESVLQLVYGDSGSDTTKQYQFKIEFAEMNNEQLKEKYLFTSSELANYKNYAKYNDSVFELVKNLRDQYRVNMNKAKYEFKAVPTQVWYPVNFSRIINNVSSNKKLQTGDLVTPEYVYERLEEIRQIHPEFSLFLPKYYGIYYHHGEPLLLLEYINNAKRLSEVTNWNKITPIEIINKS